jgi:prepilin-type N-terminal cleavage/methylation domain-containing protein
VTTNREHGTGSGPATSNRGGFTLVELLVAMIILTVGLLALLGTSALDSRAIMRERNIDYAAIYAARRLELLRIDACRGGVTGPSGGSEFLIRGNDTLTKNAWSYSTALVLGSVSSRGITMTSTYFKAPTRMYGDTRGYKAVTTRTDTYEARVSCSL